MKMKQLREILAAFSFYPSLKTAFSCASAPIRFFYDLKLNPNNFLYSKRVSNFEV
jgi:hypothetical protein